MAVLRIVANIPVHRIEDAAGFYRDVLGLDIVMDHGWIATFASQALQSAQVSVATEGGSGAPVPYLSIEVDDLDETHSRAVAAGFAIAYGPVSEPWGVRRFFVRDPFGRLVNVLTHGDLTLG